MSIRGAEDERPQGSCANTHYPVPHQIGQSDTGTDPILDLGQHWTIRCERPNSVVVGKSVRVRLEHVFPMVAGRRKHFVA